MQCSAFSGGFTCKDLVRLVLSCVHEVFKTLLEVACFPRPRPAHEHQGLGGERGQGRSVHGLRLLEDSSVRSLTELASDVGLD